MRFLAFGLRRPKPSAACATSSCTGARRGAFSHRRGSAPAALRGHGTAAPARARHLGRQGRHSGASRRRSCTGTRASSARTTASPCPKPSRTSQSRRRGSPRASRARSTSSRSSRRRAPRATRHPRTTATTSSTCRRRRRGPRARPRRRTSPGPPKLRPRARGPSPQPPRLALFAAVGASPPAPRFRAGGPRALRCRRASRVAGPPGHDAPLGHRRGGT